MYPKMIYHTPKSFTFLHLHLYLHLQCSNLRDWSSFLIIVAFRFIDLLIGFFFLCFLGLFSSWGLVVLLGFSWSCSASRASFKGVSVKIVVTLAFSSVDCLTSYCLWMKTDEFRFDLSCSLSDWEGSGFGGLNGLISWAFSDFFQLVA